MLGQISELLLVSASRLSAQHGKLLPVGMLNYPDIDRIFS